MKWFQQQTNALYDPKIVKLIKQFGAAGFGVYQGINILVAERDSEDLTLEHDLEGLKTLFNSDQVYKIVEYCIKIGLLSRKKGKIQNLKIAKYIGNWQKRTPKTYGDPTEGLQRPYRDPTAKKEEKEGREEKEEIRTEVKETKKEKPNDGSNQIPKDIQRRLDKIAEYQQMLQNPKYGSKQCEEFKAAIKMLEAQIDDINKRNGHSNPFDTPLTDF